MTNEGGEGKKNGALSFVDEKVYRSQGRTLEVPLTRLGKEEPPSYPSMRTMSILTKALPAFYPNTPSSTVYRTEVGGEGLWLGRGPPMLP